MLSDPSTRPRWTPNRLALAIGGAVALAVVVTLGDPGVTTDEPLDVRPGRTYVSTLLETGWRFFERTTVDRVFRDNAEHPPLGRWLLGIASNCGQPFEVLIFGADPLNLSLWSARFAPAAAFGALVALVVSATARRYGTAAGASAGFALAVMPRLFAHAHFGALDMFITLFWTLGLFSADRALTARRPVLAMIGAGACWSLALLTKIHAWFLIPVVAVWALVRLKRPGPALFAFASWGVTGLALFVAGWPWLWFDTLSRLRAYLGTGVARATIQVLYFGQVYADKDVPWHYPWFYFAATVPVGLQLLGALGLAAALKARRSDPFPLLLAASMGLLLVTFSTRVPVYDGERLFLPIFPLWAVFIGRGFGVIWAKLPTRRWARTALLATLVGQSYGIIALHPFELSYYNLLVGGLPGAERLGLELTFWGDAVDGVLLDRLVLAAPAEAPAALVPTLYPGQGIASTTRAMARRPLLLGDQESAPQARWLVVSRRTAYWSKGLRERLSKGRVIAVRTRQGVWLSAVYEVEPSAPLRSGPSSSVPFPSGPRSPSIVPSPSSHRGDDS